MRWDSTGLKVEIAFGCLVALLIGVSWMGLSRMGQINASTNRLFDERWEKLYATRLAASYYNSTYRIAVRVFLMGPRDKEETSALVAQLNENVLKGSSAWKQVRSQAGSEEERDLLRKVDAAKVPADASLQRSLSLLAARGKTLEADKTMVSETMPLLDRYRDAWTDFIQYEEKQMDQARMQTRASYAEARRLSTMLILFAIALAVCIVVFATRRLSREMEERESAQSAIRNLNEGLERKVAERTEELALTVETLKEEVNGRRAQETDLRRLAAIVEFSDDAIIAASLDGMITDWNPGAERMLGFTRDEIIGGPISLITPRERSHEPLECQARLLKGESVVRLESVRKRKDGNLIHVAISVSPVKDQIGRMVGASAIMRDMTERKFMEDVQRRSEASFRSFVENAPFGILRTTPEGKIVQANPALVDMLGYESEHEVLGLRMGTDVYRNPGEHEEATQWSRNQDSVRGIEVEWKHKSGRPFTVRCAAHVVKDSTGNVEFLEGFVEDISERRALEQQLRQGQKMEAIGRLAGGIAHDFNNLLGVIIGYGDLVLEQAGADNPLQKPVEQIRKAAERASVLTRQLLAFSRQQVLEMKVLNLNEVVAEMGNMLPRLLGEDIHLETILDPALGKVKADQGQIEQVLMNLAVNARDAMPGGGQLLIQTKKVSLGEGFAYQQPAMVPGEYAMMVVKDTGMGMDAQTQAHIFEPFFTTKERGKGTGLGLATVYGFVKQSGGYVWVKSETGVGSTFTIYLPQVREEAAQNLESIQTAAPSRGAGTVLLVEDEESLRTLTRSILEQSGYTVLEACDGMEAVEIAREHPGPIHLLLTDMVMPGMNGRVAAQKVSRLHPDISVVYMSGYTGFSAEEAASLDAIIIPKPFSRDVLLQNLGEAMNFVKKSNRT
jgi:two-component system cell cycle sensor histidine kinase/response regulator CckA